MFEDKSMFGLKIEETNTVPFYDKAQSFADLFTEPNLLYVSILEVSLLYPPPNNAGKIRPSVPLFL